MLRNNCGLLICFHICLLVRFVNAQVYFGVSLGSVLLGGNIYLNFFLTSLVEIPGNAFAIWAMDR